MSTAISSNLSSLLTSGNVTRSVGLAWELATFALGQKQSVDDDKTLKEVIQQLNNIQGTLFNLQTDLQAIKDSVNRIEIETVLLSLNDPIQRIRGAFLSIQPEGFNGLPPWDNQKVIEEQSNINIALNTIHEKLTGSGSIISQSLFDRLSGASPSTKLKIFTSLQATQIQGMAFVIEAFYAKDDIEGAIRFARELEKDIEEQRSKAKPHLGYPGDFPLVNGLVLTAKEQDALKHPWVYSCARVTISNTNNHRYLTVERAPTHTRIAQRLSGQADAVFQNNRRVVWLGHDPGKEKLLIRLVDNEDRNNRFITIQAIDSKMYLAVTDGGLTIEWSPGMKGDKGKWYLEPDPNAPNFCRIRNKSTHTFLCAGHADDPLWLMLDQSFLHLGSSWRIEGDIIDDPAKIANPVSPVEDYNKPPTAIADVFLVDDEKLKVITAVTVPAEAVTLNGPRSWLALSENDGSYPNLQHIIKIYYFDDGKVALKTSSGFITTPLSTGPGVGISEKIRLDANGVHPSAIFKLHKLGNGFVAFEDKYGRFLCKRGDLLSVSREPIPGEFVQNTRNLREFCFVVHHYKEVEFSDGSKCSSTDRKFLSLTRSAAQARLAEGGKNTGQTAKTVYTAVPTIKSVRTRIGFQVNGHNGQFVYWTMSGQSNAIKSSSDETQVYPKFQIDYLTEDRQTIALKAPNGLYVSARPETGWVLIADQPTISDSEVFRLRFAQDPGSVFSACGGSSKNGTFYYFMYAANGLQVSRAERGSHFTSDQSKTLATSVWVYRRRTSDEQVTLIRRNGQVTTINPET